MTYKMHEDADDKLVEYLGWNFNIGDLLDLWAKLDDYFLSADESGVADHLVGTYGAEKIWEILSVDLIPKLVSEDPYEHEEALSEMRAMGFELSEEP